MLGGFVVLGDSMFLRWVRHQYCESGITYSKPCWQSGITEALQLCGWEQIGCLWPKTLVEFKLVVSHFKFTRWLNIDTYIKYTQSFQVFHVLCKCKEYDWKVLVSVHCCPLILNWKATARSQSWRPSHPFGGCGVQFVCAATLVRMSCARVCSVTYLWAV